MTPQSKHIKAQNCGIASLSYGRDPGVDGVNADLVESPAAEQSKLPQFVTWDIVVQCGSSIAVVIHRFETDSAR